jgi:hypothetical protein
MTAVTTSFAEGAIEATFLQQQGCDPFTATPERTAQIRDVATRMGVVGIVNAAGEDHATREGQK